jgi:hypothetical protein
MCDGKDRGGKERAGLKVCRAMTVQACGRAEVVLLCGPGVIVELLQGV